MTPIEYGILKMLTQHAGRVFSMEQIYESVWNEPAFNPENTRLQYILAHQEKIEINPESRDI